MRYCDKKITEFIDELSSKNSMPGGGTASALVALNALALVVKVCTLTIGKEKYKENEELVKSVKSTCEKLKLEFINLMDSDAEKFKAMEVVFEMPNETLDDKKLRKEKMESACKICCEVPKEIISKSIEIYKCINEITGKSNVSAASDLNIAKIFIISAICGAWENIAINLKYINDENFKNEQIKFYENISSMMRG